ncbi:MAG: hypothetical protein KDA61_13245 [Planctomycetales bacterium]|nr:hypothetical protein [Planctomycetales bacterium]
MPQHVPQRRSQFAASRTWMWAVVALAASGCHLNMAYRDGEGSCPTDARAIYCGVGEQAVRKCPCHPDEQFHGYKPTCWNAWPTGWDAYRDERCAAACACETPAVMSEPMVETTPTPAYEPAPTVLPAYESLPRPSVDPQSGPKVAPKIEIRNEPAAPPVTTPPPTGIPADEEGPSLPTVPATPPNLGGRYPSAPPTLPPMPAPTPVAPQTAELTQLPPVTPSAAAPARTANRNPVFGPPPTPQPVEWPAQPTESGARYGYWYNSMRK